MIEALLKEKYRGLLIQIVPDEWGAEDFSDELKDPDPFHTFGRWGGYSLFEHEGGADEWHQHILTEYHDQIAWDCPALDWSPYLEDYDLMDDDKEPGAAKSIDAARDLVERWIADHLVVLPLYIYEHGGITMSTGAYNCPWDSGQAGYMYIDKREARRLWDAEAVESGRVEELMRDRVKYLAAICEGSIYGYVISRGDEVVESCYGYVETEHDPHKMEVYKDAVQAADTVVESDQAAHLRKKKAEIKNGVPLLSRT